MRLVVDDTFNRIQKLILSRTVAEATTLSSRPVKELTSSFFRTVAFTIKKLAKSKALTRENTIESYA